MNFNFQDLNFPAKTEIIQYLNFRVKIDRFFYISLFEFSR